MQSQDHGFKSNSGRGRWSLREGQLPHVADAISLFDQSWSETGKKGIIKCLLKSTSLDPEHAHTLRHVLALYQDDIIDIANPDHPSSASNHATEPSNADEMVLNMQEARDILSREASQHSQLSCPYDESRLQGSANEIQIQQIFDISKEASQEVTKQQTAEVNDYVVINASI
eukprot:IDg11986t1